MSVTRRRMLVMLGCGVVSIATVPARHSGSKATVDEWLADTPNYSGIDDERGQSHVTIAVGGPAGQDHFVFHPPAIRIDPGTTVTWRWNGGYHAVREVNDRFESQLTDDSTHTFRQRFSATGTYLYECPPHTGQGMKGAVVIGDPRETPNPTPTAADTRQTHQVTATPTATPEDSSIVESTEEPSRGFLTNDGSDSLAPLNDPFTLTVVGFVLSILGILGQLIGRS